MLKPFLLKNLGMDELIFRMRNFYSKMMIIKKRLKAKVLTKFSKVEVLETYFCKIYGVIQAIATSRNDNKANKLYNSIMAIPQKVLKHCFMQFI